MIDPGTLLQDRYRVGAQIGKGGMGEVYLATDLRFQSTVAIKRTFYDDTEMRKAFEREARLLNRLRHPALPRVSDHFSEGGGQFLVMEFIDGYDLSELLRQRKIPFPLAEVLDWADELLDALDYLHTQQPPVVHRDIKPHNIKLTSAGKVMLLDFGLAKAMLGQTTDGTAQSIFGYSLNFAPLEQIQGTGTDLRSDLYSLAATLYYLLTAMHPPDALTRVAAIVKHQPDPLRPAHLVQPQVPAAVSRILHRAMSQNSDLRHASAAELRAELRQATPEAVALPREASALPSAVQFLTQSIQTPQLVGPTAAPVQSEPAASTVRERPQSEIHARPLQHSSPQSFEAINRTDSRRHPHLSDSHTMVAAQASSRRSISSNRTLVLVVCLLVVCAGTIAYLLSNASDKPAHAPAINAEAQASEPLQQQAATTEQRPADATPLTADSSQDAPASNGSQQSTTSRPLGVTQSSGAQTTIEEANAQSRAEMGTKGAGSTSDNAKESEAGVSSTGRQGLVIQNPVPATSQADESRRAEAARREPQPEPRPEYAGGPPPGGPYPPPPDRRPPPPDGRRPPPDFRPPHP
jgi:serine/threonine protein kinase